jgi:hypothetical protein
MEGDYPWRIIDMPEEYRKNRIMLLHNNSAFQGHSQWLIQQSWSANPIPESI